MHLRDIYGILSTIRSGFETIPDRLESCRPAPAGFPLVDNGLGRALVVGPFLNEFSAHGLDLALLFFSQEKLIQVALFAGLGQWLFRFSRA